MIVLIPMAGRGSRFSNVGYTFPKPLIEVFHKPMIQIIVENLGFDAHYVFLVLKEHYDKYALNYLLPLITRPNPCTIIQVDQVTEGAACTALLAEKYINTDEELIIANSDQWVDWDNQHFLNYMRSRKADGGILSFYSTHPKWSFCKIDELSNKVTEVAEKKPISSCATVGIYYWRQGQKFVETTKQMIADNARVNNEFYVCPTYNWLIKAGGNVYPYPVAEMKGLGTPEDLERFINDKNLTSR